MENKKFMWVWYVVIFVAGLIIGAYLLGGFKVTGQSGSVINASSDNPNQGINE